MGCIGPSIVLQFGSLYKLPRYDVTITLHNLQVPGRDFQSQFLTDRASANCLHQHTDAPGVDPHPTWETELHLPVPLRDKKVLNESSRQLFFLLLLLLQSSTIQPLKAKQKSGKKGFVREGSKPRTLVVSENMFRCLYMSGYALFDMCVDHFTYLLSRSPFFPPIFTSKHQKSILNNMSQSILSISIPRDKQKSNSLDP